MLLDLWQVKYIFLYCLGAAFFRVVPFVSTVMIGVVAAMHCYLTSENLFRSAALFLAYAYVDARLSSDIFDKNFKASAYVGMSVFLGLYSFGL